MKIFRNIYVERGGINQVHNYFAPEGRVLIVTDNGVPEKYVACLKKQLPQALVFQMHQGEENKNFATLQRIVSCMAEADFSRSDAIIALGGGVVGDVAGLAAGLYMRGISWYNIPTTVLAQVDASVGGKTAINHGGVKNLIGLFNQPEAVLIDVAVLETLPERHRINGLIEAVKMGAILDESLMFLIKEDYMERMEEIVIRCIEGKNKIVQEDEREKDLRRILNFGHTIGHGFESTYMGELLHGEAVACGMLAMSYGETKKRLEEILNRLGVLDTLKQILSTLDDTKKKKIKEAILLDKKNDLEGCNVVVVEQVGSCMIQKVSIEELFGKVDGFNI